MRHKQAIAEHEVTGLAGGDRVAEEAAACAASLVDSWPVPAASLFNVNAELQQPVLDLERITAIFRADFMAAAWLLRLAVRRGMAPDSPSLYAVVEMLASAGLREFVLTATLLDESRSDTAALNKLVRHTSLTASLSARLARLCSLCDVELAALAGLLHDIGKVPFLLHGEKPEVTAPPPTVVGRWVAEQWAYPQVIRDVIAHHDDATAGATGPVLVAIVAAAHQFAGAFGCAADSEPPAVHQELHPLAIVRENLRAVPALDARQIVQAMQQELETWRRQRATPMERL